MFGKWTGRRYLLLSICHQSSPEHSSQEAPKACVLTARDHGQGSSSHFTRQERWEL